MKNYYSYNPVKFIFGKGMISNITNEVKPYKKILLIYGENSIKKNGCYQQLKKVLKDKKIFEFAGVTPNPELDQACSAINFAKSKKIEFMIAAEVAQLLILQNLFHSPSFQNIKIIGN